MRSSKKSMRRPVSLLLTSFAIACAVGLPLWIAYAATTRTWTGAGIANPNPSFQNNNWTNPFNWSSNVQPIAGDDLVFGAAGVQQFQTTSNNNFASGTIFRSLSMSGGHSMSGSGIALTNGLTASGGQIALASVKLNNTQTFTAPTAGATTTVTSTIDLSPTANSLNTLFIDGPGNFTFNGAMNAGGFVKGGAGTTTLLGVASTLSTTNVNAGTLQLGKTGGSLGATSPLAVGDSVGASNSAVVRLLVGNQTQQNITVFSDGLYDLNGLSNSTTELTVNGGSVTIGTGTLTTTAGANTFMTAGSITSTGAGKLLLGGNVTTSAASGTATIGGNVDLGGSTRTVTTALGGFPGADLIISGVIGNGGLTKAGAGMLSLSGANTYSGVTTVTAGRLSVMGDQPSSAVNVTGGTLSGQGRVGPVNATGGTIAPAGFSNPLDVQGNVTFTPAVTYRVSFQILSQTISTDQLNVVGNVNLGGSSLELSTGKFSSVK